MARDMTNKIISIEGEKQLEHMIELSEQKLVIIDVHEKWCGPCVAVSPFYNALWIDVTAPDDRLIPATLDRSDPKINKTLQNLLGNELKISEQGCRPFFILLRNKQFDGVVNGCNTPQLRMLIDLHIPKIKKVES